MATNRNAKVQVLQIKTGLKYSTQVELVWKKGLEVKHEAVEEVMTSAVVGTTKQ